MPLIREVLLTIGTVVLYILTWAIVACVAVMIGLSVAALLRQEWINFFGGIAVSLLMVGIGWMFTDITNMLSRYSDEWRETVEEDKNDDEP